MGAGVAQQCSENRCLARWTVWIPHRGRRGGTGRANSKKDLVTGPIRGFCALQVVRTAAGLRPAELRTLDAIHLATALSLGEDLGVLCAYDARLGDASAAAGVEVVAPT